MYQLHEVTPDLFQVTLAAPEHLGYTWGDARNVYVFAGKHPALLDSGYAESQDALHAALRELDIAPEAVQRIALTSSTADAIGGISSFPNARVWMTHARDAQKIVRARAYVQKIFDALLSLPEAPDTWEKEHAETLLETMFPAALDDAQILEDGQPIRLGNWILDALHTPGLSHESAAYFAADRGWLFSGPAINMTPRPVPYDPGQILETMGAVGSMSVKKVLPVRGPIDDFPDIFFRTLSLHISNMRANMKYIFEHPQSSIDLVASDFGYWPEDLFEVAARLMTYDAVFREFEDAGVVHVVEEGLVKGFPRFQMGAPGAGRGDATNN